MASYCWFSGFILAIFFSQTLSFRLLIYSQKAPRDEIYKYKEKQFKVPVDHFDFSDNTTFKMRYFLNNTWQRGKNPPIFFYTGNEGPIEVFTQNTGFMWDIAPEFGALLIFAEHRYYGKSKPFENKNYSDPKYLGYLNSEQALADYVDLIKYLKKSQPELKKSPVIVFGGSYGGMLSAWMRLKYPHIVQGAIASSAPILQFSELTDCEAFQRIVTSDFRAANPTCPKLIRKSWPTITNITSNDKGLKWLSESWKLCKPLTNSSQVQIFKDWLNEVYGLLAMVDYPYETNFLAPLPEKPINEVCKYLTDPTLSGKALLLSLFKAVSVYTNYTGTTKCIDINDASPELETNLWNYQSCTEMVIPMCSDGKNDMFESIPWSMKNFTESCYNNFKIKPQADLVCSTYGCKDLPTASNIIFSNGLLDPWSSGGVLRNLSSTAVAVIIPEGAHHLDLRGRNPKDPYSVIKARKYFRYYIDNWIKEYRKSKQQ